VAEWKPARVSAKMQAKKPVRAKTAPKAARKSPASAGKAKHAGGRPTDYNPELHPALAEAWATAGRTDKQIAEKLGISESTLNLWKKKHPEFSESQKRGRSEPDDQVERSLFERAIGYINRNAVKIFMPAGADDPVYAPYAEHVAPDVTAQIFWLKNRRPDRWRDRREFTGPDGGPLEIANLTPAERKSRIAALEAKRAGKGKA
jgi:hypothetical protein